MPVARIGNRLQIHLRFGREKLSAYETIKTRRPLTFVLHSGAGANAVMIAREKGGGQGNIECAIEWCGASP